jgi:hypothetical protein
MESDLIGRDWWFTSQPRYERLAAFGAVDGIQSIQRSEVLRSTAKRIPDFLIQPIDQTLSNQTL